MLCPESYGQTRISAPAPGSSSIARPRCRYSINEEPVAGAEILVCPYDKNLGPGDWLIIDSETKMQILYLHLGLAIDDEPVAGAEILVVWADKNLGPGDWLLIDRVSASWSRYR